MTTSSNKVSVFYWLACLVRRLIRRELGSKVGFCRVASRVAGRVEYWGLAGWPARQWGFGGVGKR